MLGLPLAFAAPAVLAALVGLAALYFLLRVTPPRPRQALFPPLRLLIGLDPKDTEPARTPWPILALRLAIGALIILAMAEPLWNSLAGLAGSGPLLVVIDDGWAAAPAFEKRDRLCPATHGSRRPRGSRGRDQAAVAGRGSHRARSTWPRSRDVCDRWRRSPIAPARETALPAIEQFLAREPKTEILWIADGVELGGASGFAARLAALTRSVEVVTDGTGARAVAGVDNEAGALAVRLTRSDRLAPAKGQVARARLAGTRSRPRAVRLRRQSPDRRALRPAGRGAQRHFRAS